MKHRKHKASAEVHLGFQIAPMIDVVFVIMLFFMVSAGQVKLEMFHNTKLPGTIETREATTMPDEIAIRIDDDGQVYLNEEPVDNTDKKELTELVGNLRQLKESSVASQAPVLVTIYATELAKYGRVIDTLDALTVANISDVSFQAAAPEN